LVIALVRRTLSWQGFWHALEDTTQITAMVFLIIAGATIFGHFMAITRAPFTLSEFVGGLPIPPMAVMLLIIM
ncbi:MAG: TRAP transporter large permease subunit, partial [Dehalococcoidales bacterium]|nr:TRAP transporter large permease subunit [Dehalococcoidales bacterium]